MTSRTALLLAFKSDSGVALEPVMKPMRRFAALRCTSSQVAGLASKVWARVNPGEPFPEVKSMPVPPADVRFRVGVSEKLTAATGWRPAYDIEGIIDDTYRFVSAAFDRAPA